MNAAIEPLNEPWYRQFWPWFLIAIPLSSGIAGFYMLSLALQTNNSLVVDDYYKQGKEINRRIERDRVAAGFGLKAQVSSTEEGVVLQLETNKNAGLPAPDTLMLRWVHATQDTKDGTASMVHLGNYRYIAAGRQLPVAGVWRLHINDPANPQWRLISDRVRLTDNSEITISSGADETADSALP